MRLHTLPARSQPYFVNVAARSMAKQSRLKKNLMFRLEQEISRIIDNSSISPLSTRFVHTLSQPKP
jgi:hypothetical protein